jgi:predicted membrane protein (TIGR00267 family)
VAAGISTGVSIFEAETLEQTIRLREIEKALLVSLEDTEIRNIARWSAFMIAAVNFCSPIITGLVLLLPFLILPPEEIRDAAWISAGLTMTILFVTGAVMARSGERNPLAQGARMAVVGVIAFVLLFWIETLI